MQTLILINILYYSLFIQHPIYPKHNEVIIKNNIGLIHKIAYTYSKNYYTNKNINEDLIQIGMITMNKCIYNYNPLKSKFSTFSYICIKRDMLRFLKKNQKYYNSIIHIYNNNDYILDLIESKQLEPMEYIEYNEFKRIFYSIVNNSETYNNITKKYDLKKIRRSNKLYKLKPFTSYKYF
jgi:RNA polymerase sigma factor (sigma-70 family)